MPEKKKSDGVLPPSTIRNLCDKLYEKRKLGSLEIEQMCKDAASTSEESLLAMVLALARELAGATFCASANPNARKGGLIALAAIAISTASVKPSLLAGDSRVTAALVPPVLGCFSDLDMRVRYYACEAMYNVSKVARLSVLMFFNEIFDGLCKLAADPDANVQNGAALLDRLIKDIVTEGGSIDIVRFVPLLRERLWISNANCRRFLLSWISALDLIPDLDMLEYLPEFAGALFNMLRDPNQGIRTTADNLLAGFLTEMIDSVSTLEPAFLASVLAVLAEECDAALAMSSVRAALPWRIALNWIHELVQCAKDRMFATEHVPQLIRVAIESMGALEFTPSSQNDAAGEAAAREEAANAASGVAEAEGGASGTGVGSSDASAGGAGTGGASSPRSRASSSASVSGSSTFRSSNPVTSSAGGSASGQAGMEPPRSLADGANEEAVDEELDEVRETIQAAAATANVTMLRLVREFPDKFVSSVGEVISVLSRLFEPRYSTPTRVAALRWVLLMHECLPAGAFDAAQGSALHSLLLHTLGDSSELVVRQDLEVLAKMASDPSHFDRLMHSLLELFRSEPALLESRCSLAMRQLAGHLSPFDLMRAAARILSQEADLDFARVMIQTLNLVLLASAEFDQVRSQLRSDSSGKLFAELYPSWCNSPTSAVALCLLCSRYEHAYLLLRRFAELEVTVALLVELDKLVQLIESPVFLDLRLALLEPKGNPGLHHAMFAILAILPQSKSFEVLNRRLGSTAPITTSIASASTTVASAGKQVNAYVDHFITTQRRHTEYRATMRKLAK